MLYKQILLVFAASFTLFTWSEVLAVAPPGFLDVYILDIGQGDAILIKSPSGNELLIDGGRDRKVISELRRVLGPDDEKISAIMITHPDADHIGGLSAVLDSYAVASVFSNGRSVDTDVFRALEKRRAVEHAKEIVVDTGDRIWLDDKTSLDIYGPDDRRTRNTKTTNGQSIVARLVYGNSSLLLAGDMDRAQELMLTQSTAELESDVLKVAHHGSKYSSTALILSKIKPATAIISAGARNRYGHPHEETLSRVANTGAKIYRTDEQGTVHLRSDGKVFRVVE